MKRTTLNNPCFLDDAFNGEMNRLDEIELFETLLELGFTRLQAERLAAGENLHHWE